MQEVEVPMEHLHEEIHHHAEHGGEKWFSAVALSTAVLAALAAVTIMLGGHYANDAMLERIDSTDRWAQYQAKGIKREINEAKVDLSKRLAKLEQGSEKGGAEVPGRDLDKVAHYKSDQAKLMKVATEKGIDSKVYLAKHITLSYATTLFQVAITIAAISVLTKRIWFWYFGMACGVVGTAIFVYAMVTTPEIKEEEDIGFLSRPAVVQRL